MCAYYIQVTLLYRTAWPSNTAIYVGSALWQDFIDRQ